MNKKCFYLYCIYAYFLLVLPSLALASINMSLDIKDSFDLGETISFNYTISSDKVTDITFIPYVQCPVAPNAMLSQQTIQIYSNKPYYGNYQGIQIMDFIQSQRCTAYIKVLSPIQQEVNKSFMILTSPSFSFNLEICKTQDCSEKSSVFTKSENVYLDYTANIESPVVKAILTYPDKTTKELELPTSIKPGQIGTYNLEVIASKEGYKNVTLKEQFGVIEEEANLANISAESKTDYLSYIYIAVAILFILVIIFVLVYYLSRKHLPTPPTNN